MGVLSYYSAQAYSRPLRDSKQKSLGNERKNLKVSLAPSGQEVSTMKKRPPSQMVA